MLDMFELFFGLDFCIEESGWLLLLGLELGDSILQLYLYISGYNGEVKIIDLDLVIGLVIIFVQEDFFILAGGFGCVVMMYEFWVMQLI